MYSILCIINFVNTFTGADDSHTSQAVPGLRISDKQRNRKICQMIKIVIIFYTWQHRRNPLWNDAVYGVMKQMNLFSAPAYAVKGGSFLESEQKFLVAEIVSSS